MKSKRKPKFTLSEEMQISAKQMIDLQSKQWGTLKIFFLSIFALTGAWLTLHFLFKWLNLNFDVTFMLGFILAHAFFATVVYFCFKNGLEEKLAVRQLKALFQHAAIIAFIGNSVMICVLISLSYLTNFALGDKLLILSPALFTVLLWAAMYRGIPLELRQYLKRARQSGTSVSTDEMDPLDTNPDSFDPENPFGRMNPASPNYLYHSDR